MSDKKLRWGVLSTSNIGRVAVNPAIQASHNGELVAVASRTEERAREFAEKSGIPTAYGSYEALLEDEGVDAIYNPLPNSLHLDWSIRAAEKGKYGYYCLPVLAGDRLVARVDLKAWRKKGVLEVLSTHYEEESPSAASRAAVESALARFGRSVRLRVHSA